MTRAISSGLSSQTKLYFNISKDVMSRFVEMSIIENLSQNKFLEKIILNYKPVPATMESGFFRYIKFQEIKTLRRIKPYAMIVSISPSKSTGISDEIWSMIKNRNVSVEEFQRKYIERLMLPDAQERIKELIKLSQSRDIYITSMKDSTDEDYSLRKTFVDFVNGDLIWK